MGLRVPAPEKIWNEGDDLRRQPISSTPRTRAGRHSKMCGPAASRSPNLTWWGHASWGETRVDASQRRPIDVQAHTKDPRLVFASDRIVDFHHPDDSYSGWTGTATGREVLLADTRRPVLRPVGHTRSMNSPRPCCDSVLCDPLGAMCRVDHCRTREAATSCGDRSAARAEGVVTEYVPAPA